MFKKKGQQVAGRVPTDYYLLFFYAGPFFWGNLILVGPPFKRTPGLPFPVIFMKTLVLVALQRRVAGL